MNENVSHAVLNKPVVPAECATPRGTVSQDEILFDVINHVGIVTLNRPKALNALSHGMVLAMDERLKDWAADDRIKAVLVRGAGGRAFCAGGDIRALHDSFQRQGDLHHDFFVDEYQLDYRIHCYPKPVIAIMDGIVMGGGMGIAQGAALRIVTERTKLAMPETGIGLIPDVGASHFLSRMPEGLGAYLGLTGISIGAADALYCGLADAWLPVAAIDNLESALARVKWTEHPLTDISSVLFAGDPLPPENAYLQEIFPAIYRHFRKADVAAIMASLADEIDSRQQAWAGRTLKTMQTRSPLTMCVTHRQLLAGGNLPLADCFRMELGLVRHCFNDGDFIEGVRALILDKDNAPCWRHRSVDDVMQERVARFFESPWSAQMHPLAELECKQ